MFVIMLFYIIIVFCIMEYLGMQYVYECAVLKKKKDLEAWIFTIVAKS